MNNSPFLKQTMQSFTGFWTARAARERKIISAGVAIVLIALFYSILINPAWSGRKELSSTLPDLRQQVALVQAMAREAAALSGKTATSSPPISKEIIEAALARKGLQAQSVTLAGDAVQVKLTSASFSATMDWLEDMQKTLLLSVSEAGIEALPNPDKVDATLTLRQPRYE